MKRTARLLGDLPELLTTDISAVVRSNVNALRRQMTHDHLVATTYLKKVVGGRRQLGWDSLFRLISLDEQLKEQIQQELAVLVGDEGWHLQGDETDYPPISVERLAEKAGVSPRRLRESLTNVEIPTPIAKELTLSESLAIAAACDVSLQQLITPPWRAVFEHDSLYGGTVKYLPSQGSIALDNWMLWVFGFESLPGQNEYVFERNQSFPPEFGDRFDSRGAPRNRNNRPSPKEIEDFNSSIIFSGKKTSWFSFLNQTKFLPSTLPSQEDKFFRDATIWHHAFHGAFLLNGFATHVRRMIRTARKSSDLNRLDKHWLYITANIAFLLGRMARSVSRRNVR